jgi:hypothetical protein
MEGRGYTDLQVRFRQKRCRHRYIFITLVSSFHICAAEGVLHVVRRVIFCPDSASTKASSIPGHVIFQTSSSLLRIPSRIRYIEDLDLLVWC